MRAALAPIEAGAAQRASPVRQAFDVDPELAEEAPAVRGHAQGVVTSSDEFPGAETIEHGDAGLARKMVVADPCAAQRRIFRPGANAHVSGPRRQPHQRFQHAGDIGAGEAKIAMACLFLDREQAGGVQLGEMTARRRQRDARFLGEFGRSERLAVHQRGEHIGAGGIAKQRGDHRDIGTVFHSSILTEACSRRHRLCCGIDCKGRINVHDPTVPRGHVAFEVSLLCVLATLWAASYSFIKLGVETIPPITLIAARTLIAGALLFVVLRLRHVALSLTPRFWRMFFVQALLNSVVPFTLIAWAEQTVDAGLATILNSTSPIFAFLITAMATRHEPVSKRKLFGVAVGLAGVALIVGVDALQGLGQHVLAQTAIVAATLCYAGAAIFGRQFAGVDPIVPATGSLLCGAVILVPASALIERPWLLVPSVRSVAALLALSIFSTSLVFTIYFRLVRTLGSVGSTAQAYLRAPIGVLIAVVALGESMATSAWAGLCCVVVGVAAMTLPERTIPEPTAKAAKP